MPGGVFLVGQVAIFAVTCALLSCCLSLIGTVASICPNYRVGWSSRKPSVRCREFLESPRRPGIKRARGVPDPRQELLLEFEQSTCRRGVTLARHRHLIAGTWGLGRLPIADELSLFRIVSHISFA